MSTTAFPTVLANVITALKAAASLSGVKVFDGAEVDYSYPKDVVAVGHDGGEQVADMTIAAIQNEYLTFGETHEESGSLQCSLWSQDGSSSFTALRIRAFALLSAVDTVIRADSTFSGACLNSWLENYTAHYRRSPKGSAVQIDFSISYRAST